MTNAQFVELARRCLQLRNKRDEGTMNAEEVKELDILQEKLDRELQRRFPRQKVGQ